MGLVKEKKMAKKVTVHKDGKKTVVVDTSKKSARQQIRSEKISTKAGLSKNAATLGVATEAIAGLTQAHHDRQETERQKSADRAKTYQAAINRWNGILKSTPDSAEGSNEGLEGTSNAQGSNNSTGTNPEFSGW